MFADDIILWTTAKNDKNQKKKLQNNMNMALEAVNKWAQVNNMIINVDKTRLSLRHNKYNFHLKIQEKDIKKSLKKQDIWSPLENISCLFFFFFFRSTL